MATTVTEEVRVGTLDALMEQGCIVVTGGGRTIAVFHHNDDVYAVDNRCPHMVRRKVIGMGEMVFQHPTGLVTVTGRPES